MTAASVGFQCPDDVRAGQQGVRQARPVRGGGVLAAVGPVTGTLVGLDVLVQLVQLALPGIDLAVRFGNLALASDGGQLIGVAQGQWYRLLTAAFLHAGLFHLLTNMFALVTLGPALEAVLGRLRFLALYLLAAAGGSTLSFLVSPPGTVGVGASGAIFGLFAAFYVIERRLGRETRPVLVLLAVNLAITFAVPRIDWRAHLGGLATGAVVALAFAYAPAGARRGTVQALACVAVGLVLAVAVALRTAALQA